MSLFSKSSWFFPYTALVCFVFIGFMILFIIVMAYIAHGVYTYVVRQLRRRLFYINISIFIKPFSHMVSSVKPSFFNPIYPYISFYRYFSTMCILTCEYHRIENCFSILPVVTFHSPILVYFNRSFHFFNFY